MLLLHYGTAMPLMEAGARSWLCLRKAVHRAHPARQTQEARVNFFPFQQTSIDDFASLSFSYSLYMMFFQHLTVYRVLYVAGCASLQTCRVSALLVLHVVRLALARLWQHE